MVARVAVVTGSNKGIGLEVVRQLLPTCSLVILACRDPSRGNEAVRSLGASPNARFAQLDIGDAASVDRFATYMRDEVGRLDVLVNNAAIAFKGSDPTPFEEQTGPTLDVNFRGTVALTERLLPLLAASARETGTARLVNVASMSGRLSQLSPARREAFSSPSLTVDELKSYVDAFERDVAAGTYKTQGWGTSNYGFSKLAIIAYTKILAREAPEGLRVNCCCPGYCKTDMTSQRGTNPPELGARNAAMLAQPECDLQGEFIREERVAAWE